LAHILRKSFEINVSFFSEMDIRDFFNPKPGSSKTQPKAEMSKSKKPASKSVQAKKRTAITDEAQNPITPPAKRPKSAKIPERQAIIELDSDVDSDPEAPLSSKFRNKSKPKSRVIQSGKQLYLLANNPILFRQ
jgi:hypothetical protein